ncbi:MAG: hypothetical protein O9327_02505 [Polaromonas sp.]|nr:hypothetical protein [Polaromonas sp.]
MRKKASGQPDDDWSRPTTFEERFGQAIERLCGGHRPDPDIVKAWLDRSQEDERLQEFAIEHGPAWCQGIVLIDAAYLLADSPTEGVPHETAASPCVATLRVRRGEDSHDTQILFRTQNDPWAHADALAASWYAETPEGSNDGEHLFNAGTLAVSVVSAAQIDPSSFAVLAKHLQLISRDPLAEGEAEGEAGDPEA